MRFRWYDLLILILLFIGTITASIFIYFSPTKGEEKYMVIERENVEIYRLNLTTIVDEVRIEINGVETKMTIVADKDGCYVKYSGCPDHDCMLRGKIIDSNDLPIICMPNQVSVRIVYE